ncbi:MAG TPA: hypothetical protein VJ552_04850 [Sediminibacterium sp.]|nr:hypothetical protein [Sediminibacterium sp.]
MNLKNVKEGELKEIFDVLEQAFQETGIDFYLIGAVARDIWYARGKKGLRKTNDIDFAVLIGSVADYIAVGQYLKEHNFFGVSDGKMLMIHAPSGVRVDILPFGNFEIDEMLQFNGQGFKEVHAVGTEAVYLETGHSFEVATLPSIVLLKLIAYDDRPDQRLKDVIDIANIIDHFFDLQTDLIYSDSNLDLFESAHADFEDTNLQFISAIVIGREIKKIVHDNADLITRIRLILKRHIELKENSELVRKMSSETEVGTDQIVEWLQALLLGITEYH